MENSSLAPHLAENAGSHLRYSTAFRFHISLLRTGALDGHVPLSLHSSSEEGNEVALCLQRYQGPTPGPQRSLLPLGGPLAS